jgi:hypothetical protein
VSRSYWGVIAGAVKLLSLTLAPVAVRHLPLGEAFGDVGIDVTMSQIQGSPSVDISVAYD